MVNRFSFFLCTAYILGLIHNISHRSYLSSVVWRGELQKGFHLDSFRTHQSPQEKKLLIRIFFWKKKRLNMYNHPQQTVSIYHKFSVWLHTWDDSSWDRNPADFMHVGYLTTDYRQSKRLPESPIHAFTRRCQPVIPHSTTWGRGSIYIVIHR